MADGHRDRLLARAVVGVHGDGAVPSWKASTTQRGRTRLFTLQLLAASEAAGTAAILVLLPTVAAAKGWSGASVAVALVVAAVGYALAGLVAVERFRPAMRVRLVQLVVVNGAVLTILVGLFPPFVILAVLLVARCVLYGLQVSAFRTLLYDAVVPEARMRAFCRVALAAAVGAAIGLFAAGLTYDDGSSVGIALAGGLAFLLALASFRLTEPGLGGVEPSRLDAAFGADPKVMALRSPMKETAARVLQVHTVRTSLSTYVAAGALSVALLYPVVLALQSSPASSDAEAPLELTAIYGNLGVVLLGVAVVMALFAGLLEKDRRRSTARIIRTAWLAPAVVGGLGALLLAFADGDSFGPTPLFVGAGIALVGGLLTKVALDVTTLSVVSEPDRPTVVAITNVSWVAGGVLSALVLLIEPGDVPRVGFVILFVLLLVAGLVGKRLMQQPDADLDAALPVDVEEVVAETYQSPETGLAAEVSPYAYVEPPPAVLDETGRPPLLSAESLNFAYGSVQVLFDVDITVAEGELVAVLGPNGVGKTTLLRNLSGLEIPQQGVVRFQGEDITKVPASKRVATGLTQIVGGNAVFGSLSVAENLQMYGFSASKDRKSVQDGIKRAYEVFPRLADRRNQLGSTLSGGEQQMLGLSKALILRPRLLIVDEFSLGLAPVVVTELLSMVRALNAEGTAVLLVEQSVNVALNLVDRCYFMEKGRVVYEGRSEALRARPDLVQALSLGGIPAELEETHA